VPGLKLNLTCFHVLLFTGLYDAHYSDRVHHEYFRVGEGVPRGGRVLQPRPLSPPSQIGQFQALLPLIPPTKVLRRPRRLLHRVEGPLDALQATH
jgi:hypothetical protein